MSDYFAPTSETLPQNAAKKRPHNESDAELRKRQRARPVPSQVPSFNLNFLSPGALSSLIRIIGEVLDIAHMTVVDEGDGGMRGITLNAIDPHKVMFIKAQVACQDVTVNSPTSKVDFCIGLKDVKSWFKNMPLGNCLRLRLLETDPETVEFSSRDPESSCTRILSIRQKSIDNEMSGLDNWSFSYTASVSPNDLKGFIKDAADKGDYMTICLYDSDPSSDSTMQDTYLTFSCVGNDSSVKIIFHSKMRHDSGENDISSTFTLDTTGGTMVDPDTVNFSSMKKLYDNSFSLCRMANILKNMDRGNINLYMDAECPLLINYTLCSSSPNEEKASFIRVAIAPRVDE